MSRVVHGKPLKVMWGSEEIQIKEWTISSNGSGRIDIEIQAVKLEPIEFVPWEWTPDWDKPKTDEELYKEAMEERNYIDAVKHAFPKRKK